MEMGAGAGGGGGVSRARLLMACRIIYIFS